MKIIFLDIDGVFNDLAFYEKRYRQMKETGRYIIDIDEERVRIFSELPKSTGAKVVLSSSWRGGWNSEGYKPTTTLSQLADELFRKYGFEVYSITKTVPSNDEKYCSWRENEINLWLSEHKDIEEFVIIDDESFDLNKYEDNRLVKTKDDLGNTGITKEHVQKAISILNEER